MQRRAAMSSGRQQVDFFHLLQSGLHYTTTVRLRFFARPSPLPPARRSEEGRLAKSLKSNRLRFDHTEGLDDSSRAEAAAHPSPRPL